MGRVFRLDMYVLEFQDFDVILGMDWLEKNLVKLDCGKKTVSVVVLNQEDLVHVCETLGDSVLTSFLYFIEIPSKPVEEVKVVKDFRTCLRR